MRLGVGLVAVAVLGIVASIALPAWSGYTAESHQVMKNIKDSLERYGASLEDVVKCTVMMADIAEWPDFNKVYVTYFPGPKPARSAFGAAGLALGGRVEVECWAELKE